MSLKTLIIDDEPFVRDDLSQMLMSCGEVETTSKAGSLSEARKQLASHRYDLVFLDVCLPGGTGFDLLPYIHAPTKVVFVTGHDDYAVRAFEVNALDYLVKPVSADRLLKTLKRVMPDTVPRFSPEDETRIAVRTDAGQRYLSPESVMAVTSLGGNYLRVLLASQERVVCRKTLREWEAQLPAAGFKRIHRSTLINTGFIHRVDRRPAGRLRVCLGDGLCFDVSRRLAPGLRQWLRDGGV